MRNAPSPNMHLSELNEIRAQREFHSLQLTVPLPFSVLYRAHCTYRVDEIKARHKAITLDRVRREFSHG